MLLLGKSFLSCFCLDLSIFRKCSWFLSSFLQIYLVREIKKFFCCPEMVCKERILLLFALQEKLHYLISSSQRPGKIFLLQTTGEMIIDQLCAQCTIYYL